MAIETAEVEAISFFIKSSRLLSLPNKKLYFGEFSFQNWGMMLLLWGLSCNERRKFELSGGLDSLSYVAASQLRNWWIRLSDQI